MCGSQTKHICSIYRRSLIYINNIKRLSVLDINYLLYSVFFLFLFLFFFVFLFFINNFTFPFYINIVLQVWLPLFCPHNSNVYIYKTITKFLILINFSIIPFFVHVSFFYKNHFLIKNLRFLKSLKLLSFNTGGSVKYI